MLKEKATLSVIRNPGTENLIILLCRMRRGTSFFSVKKTRDHIEIKDNIFSQIDHTWKFILRNIRKSAWINPQTGRREEQYELPHLAIREAIANAVAHRDYRIPSHIDVAVFDDRVEVWSPGELPFGIKMKDILKKHISVLRNPAIAEVLFLAGYIERWGTGIEKMNRLMQEQGLPVPEYKEISGNFVVIFKRKEIKVGEQVVLSRDQVGTKLGLSWDEIERLLSFCSKEQAISNIQRQFKWTNRTKFRNKYINPLLQEGFLKMTLPDKPQSSKQRYVITEKGKQVSESS